ncbi:replication initiation protein, partial [Enterococcus sp. C1(2024)]|nr:replication initiation protein [Enterococcus faecalis]EGO2674404.1 replication initiation protein [Enterococcus faecalis]EGO7797034.1 replication initiation protein [Enterococcus faecalis]EGO7797087.1 replication initiation protein [Enterococcus faecalis]EGO9060520.1 replication initiation protein [Enterococcus faecalis]
MKSNSENSGKKINPKKPAVSNSRLNRHIMYTPEPKLHFDAMTIVGNLNKNN